MAFVRRQVANIYHFVCEDPKKHIIPKHNIFAGPAHRVDDAIQKRATSFFCALPQIVVLWKGKNCFEYDIVRMTQVEWLH